MSANWSCVCREGTTLHAASLSLLFTVRHGCTEQAGLPLNVSAFRWVFLALESLPSFWYTRSTEYESCWDCKETFLFFLIFFSSPPPSVNSLEIVQRCAGTSCSVDCDMPGLGSYSVLPTPLLFFLSSGCYTHSGRDSDALGKFRGGSVCSLACTQKNC